MYDELVKRLRRIAVNERSESSYQDVMQAAGVIEELQKRVPKRPHGRLIDADELMLKIQEYIEEYDEMDENGYHSLKWCAMKETEMAINDAPTIIPAEKGDT